MEKPASNYPVSRLETCRINVERAIGELRSNRPILIQAGTEIALAWTVDNFCKDIAERLERIVDGKARLVLTASRLTKLGVTREEDGAIALPELNAARIENLSFARDAGADAPVQGANALDIAALELARLALLTPAVVIASLSQQSAAQLPFLTVKNSDIHAYRELQILDMHIVTRAPVPLENAKDSEFVIFRGGDGLRDQVAVIVGKPDLSKHTLVRIHSACLTGDLFGSLKCDCGDQLRSSVRLMAEKGGGILLYLDQEGRGHGLANKMRAYKLQAEGLDTYEADEVLGFGIDQRRFDVASEMLKQLGLRQVRLLTNNPEKADVLRKAGFDVIDDRLTGRITAENIHYLNTKRDKAGHKLDLGAIVPPLLKD
ncbi:MAG: GTP cyclohydrolase II RibA [Pseudomonadota bacterium]